MEAEDLLVSARQRPISKQAWCDLQKACRMRGLGFLETQKFIAEASGIPLVALDPSTFTWGHFLQVIEQLEKLEAGR